MPPKTIPFSQPKTIPFSKSPTPIEPPKQSLASRIWSDLSRRGENVVNEITNTNQNPLLSGVKATAQAFGGVADVGEQLVRTVPGGGAILDKTAEVISKATDPENKGLLQEIGRFLASQEQNNPRVVKAISGLLEGTSAGGEISGAILSAGTFKPTIGKPFDLARQLITKSEQQIEASIIKNFEQAVKPTIGGKTSATKLENYRDDIVQGVKTIKGNKLNLSFVDDTGEVISGETPKSLQQLQESIDQTKKVIFSQYDSIAQRANQAGATVKLEPIASELDTIINNRALRITNPRAIDYAEALKDRLVRTGDLDATTAQEIIQNYNKSLEAFYRNPSYDTASQAAIDALIANRLRQALDDEITGLVSPEYQAIKNEYASLKAIEKDVVKAALREARKNNKGLVDFTDIFSGGQVVSGILSFNPGLVAQGLTQKAIAEYIKFLNSPNRAVEQMFKAAESLKP